MATATRTSGTVGNDENILKTTIDVDRKFTINIEVVRPAKVDVDEIFDSLEDRCFLPKTKMLQQVNRNKFRWSVATVEDAQKFVDELIEHPMKVGGSDTIITYASKVQTFNLWDTPYELTKGEIIGLLSDFGQVQDIRWTKHHRDPNVMDGRIIVTMFNVKRRPPSSILLSRTGRITIRAPGEKFVKQQRQQYCYKCKAVGEHWPQECPGDTVCHFCRAEGHRQAACPMRLGQDINPPADPLGLNDDPPLNNLLNNSNFQNGGSPPRVPSTISDNSDKSENSDDETGESGQEGNRGAQEGGKKKRRKRQRSPKGNRPEPNKELFPPEGSALGGNDPSYSQITSGVKSTTTYQGPEKRTNTSDLNNEEFIDTFYREVTQNNSQEFEPIVKPPITSTPSTSFKIPPPIPPPIPPRAGMSTKRSDMSGSPDLRQGETPADKKMRHYTSPVLNLGPPLSSDMKKLVHLSKDEIDRIQREKERERLRDAKEGKGRSRSRSQDRDGPKEGKNNRRHTMGGTSGQGRETKSASSKKLK